MFDVKSKKLIENVDVFEGSRISEFRITLDFGTVIMFGGKKVAVAKILTLNSNPR